MASFSHLNAEQARALIASRSPVIADIRDFHSFAAAHIQGSVSLNNENLPDFMLHQASDNPVIVVCYHGISSQGAAQYLAEQGFSEVYNLDGGFTAWQQIFPDLVNSQQQKE